MSCETNLTIAGLTFRLSTKDPLKITENGRPFCTNGSNADFLLDFQPVDELPSLSGEIVYEGTLLTVVAAPDGFIRRFRDTARNVFAVARVDEKTSSVKIFHEPAQKRSNMGKSDILTYGCFEELLLSRGRLIFHAALIETPFGGILFSGPSGIGKSTQADLWVQYASSELINGDRPILYKSDGVWLGCGSPYAGSSRCYKNRSVPIRAIVMLAKADTCQIRPMGVGEAFRSVLAQTTVNAWNPAFVNDACDLVTELIMDVPVYHMACPPNREAVDALKEVLAGGKP